MRARPRAPAAAVPDYTVVSIETDDARAETLARWIRGALGVEPVELRRPESERVWLDLYFEDDVRARLALAAAQRHPGVAGVTVRACRPRDWTRFWRRHFQPLDIAGLLRIRPPWARARRTRGVAELVLDPGLSFGTGRHFTTRFCLERLVATIRAERPRSVLDAGTGSGILALAAARLGVPRVDAFDNDPLSVAHARENLRRNRLTGRVRLRVADALARPPRGAYDLVVANLYGGLLVRLADVLAAAARRTLILSGIRELEADEVAAAFQSRGLDERVRDGDGEWCGLEFRRPAGLRGG